MTTTSARTASLHMASQSAYCSGALVHLYAFNSSVHHVYFGPATLFDTYFPNKNQYDNLYPDDSHSDSSRIHMWSNAGSSSGSGMSQQADDNITDAIFSIHSDGLAIILRKTENHGIEQVSSPLQTSGMTGAKQCNFFTLLSARASSKNHIFFFHLDFVTESIYAEFICSV